MTTTASARAITRIGIAVLLAVGVSACATAASVTPTASGTTASTSDPASSWPTFSSASGVLSFRYDRAWKPVQCPPNESPLIVLGVNTCGQIEPTFDVDSVPAAQAPVPADLRCDPSQPGALSSSVTVDGVTGTKDSIDYTTAAYDNCRHPIARAVVYSFYTGGRAYTVEYLYIPSAGPDQTSEIAEMVQTLRFSA